MQLKSTQQRYGAIPIAIHWLSALAIPVMLASGIAAANTADETAKLGILRIHVSLGACILVLSVLLTIWWVFLDRRPASKAGLPRWQVVLSKIVHYGMYGVIVVMLASGVAMAILSGLVPMLLGAPGTLPDFTKLPPFFAHGLGGFAMIGLLTLHIIAALYHQFWRRDRLLARMGIGPS